MKVGCNKWNIASFLLIFPLGLLLAGFDYSKRSIDTDEIMSGGPGKDGIPSLTNPKFVKASDKKGTAFLADHDKVLGVVIEGAAKAYPIKILSWHEAVNDEAGGTKYLVTW